MPPPRSLSYEKRPGLEGFNTAIAYYCHNAALWLQNIACDATYHVQEYARLEIEKQQEAHRYIMRIEELEEEKWVLGVSKQKDQAEI